MIGGGRVIPTNEESPLFLVGMHAIASSSQQKSQILITQTTMTMSSINEPCYGILCHRQYVDRVSNALLAIDDEWRTIDGKKEEVTPTSTTPSVDQSSKCLLVPTSMEKGPRKSRTGYSLLVIQNCIMSPAQLPPTARRQLSWAGRLSHKTEIKSPCVAEEENNITGKKRTRGNEKEEDEQ
eukprot:scaffold14924_cov152-Skeletonema_marinoi.AAC.2